MKPNACSRVDDSAIRTWDNCEAVLSPLKSPFKMFAQFPSPHFSTAAISSRSSALDHGFLFFFWGKFPSIPPAEVAEDSGCFLTGAGRVISVPSSTEEACEFSAHPFCCWALGAFIDDGVSIVKLLGTAESVGKPDAISTWQGKHRWMRNDLPERSKKKERQFSQIVQKSRSER